MPTQTNRTQAIQETADGLRVLVVEDDPALGATTRRRLRDLGFDVTLSDDGSKALAFIEKAVFDVIVLDLMLPGVSGMDILGGIRSRGILTPVIVVSGQDDLEIRVEALELGADDFLIKPFEYQELHARIKAVLRRAGERGRYLLEVDDLVFDCVKREAKRAGTKLELRPKEADLLEFLLRNRNKVIPRSEILKAVWEVAFDPGTNIVDVYISYLRSSVDKYSSRPLIHTIRGRGFMLMDPPPQS